MMTLPSTGSGPSGTQAQGERGAASLDAYWMPFTPNREFKRTPRLVESAQGLTYRTPEGREVLDGTSGLWCVGAGHRHPRIAEAMKRQIDVLDFASSFQVGHPLAFELAERLGALAPPGRDRVFLVNSGSEACDRMVECLRAAIVASANGAGA